MQITKRTVKYSKSAWGVEISSETTLIKFFQIEKGETFILCQLRVLFENQGGKERRRRRQEKIKSFLYRFFFTRPFFDKVRIIIKSHNCKQEPGKKLFLGFLVKHDPCKDATWTLPSPGASSLHHYVNHLGHPAATAYITATFFNNWITKYTTKSIFQVFNLHDYSPSFWNWGIIN